MSNVLERIVEQKRLEIAEAQRRRPLESLQADVAKAPSPRDFLQALRAHHPMGLIAEIKRASPSAGLIREDFDPVLIGRTYAEHGAACISVLTDEHFFQGHLRFLEEVRAAVEVPVLRKDFLIDPYQVWEARASGADCILLIAECLDDARLEELAALAADLGMQSLIELYEPENLPRVLRLHPPVIGINNRNLKTFQTDLEHVLRMRKQIPEEILVVAESGIRTRENVKHLEAHGVHAMLVGETLMRSPDIGAAVRELLGHSPKIRHL